MKDMKGWRRLKSLLEQQGCDCVTNRNHIKIYRDGQLIAVTGTTPSDPRAVRNFVAALRRRGLIVA